MRLFTGIALTEECRAAVSAAVAPLRADPAPVSWVAPGNLHITMKFLGESSRDRVAAIGVALTGVAANIPPFVLQAEGARLPLPAGMEEWVSPIAAVVSGQLFAVALARTRGLDPDQPRGLSKVTETL